MAAWWAKSLEGGPLSRPSEAAVRLWLQLAEQARGLGDSSPQFVRIVATVTRTVRADVLAALKGSRSLDDVPWFSALQQCPHMANDVLFSWDDYNERVSDVKSVARLAKLPLLLSDVVMGSDATMGLLKRMSASKDVQVKYAAVRVLVLNESVAALDWAQRCLDSVGSEMNSADKATQAAADACIVSNPSLLAHGAVKASVTVVGPYSAALWRLICDRRDVYPWAKQVHVLIVLQICRRNMRGTLWFDAPSLLSSAASYWWLCEEECAANTCHWTPRHCYVP